MECPCSCNIVENIVSSLTLPVDMTVDNNSSLTIESWFIDSEPVHPWHLVYSIGHMNNIPPIANQIYFSGFSASRDPFSKWPRLCQESELGHSDRNFEFLDIKPLPNTLLTMSDKSSYLAFVQTLYLVQILICTVYCYQCQVWSWGGKHGGSTWWHGLESGLASAGPYTCFWFQWSFNVSIPNR